MSNSSWSTPKCLCMEDPMIKVRKVSSIWVFGKSINRIFLQIYLQSVDLFFRQCPIFTSLQNQFLYNNFAAHYSIANSVFSCMSTFLLNAPFSQPTLLINFANKEVIIIILTIFSEPAQLQLQDVAYRVGHH